MQIGRTPYRLSTANINKEIKPNPGKVNMLNIAPLLDNEKYCKAGFLDNNKKRYCYGTTRINRTLQQKGSDLQQLARVDWELPPPGRQPDRNWPITESNSQAITEIAKHFGSVDAVVVKDIGKGVVSWSLLRVLLQKCKKLKTVPWFISTRYWEPSWLMELARNNVNVRMVMFSEVAAKQTTVPTWITSKGKLTKEAILKLKTVVDAFTPDRSRVSRLSVVVNLAKLQLMAMERRTNQEPSLDQLTCYVQPNENPNSENLSFDIGGASIIYGSLIHGMLQESNLGGKVDPKQFNIGSLYQNALGYTESWIVKEIERILEVPNQASIANKSYIATNYDESADADADTFRIVKYAIKDDKLIPIPLTQVGEIVEFQASHALQQWEDAFTKPYTVESSTDIDESSPGRKKIQLWRAMSELRNYICCEELKRNAIARFRDRVAQFDPRDDRSSLSTLIHSPPGAGKSHLVQCLADTLDNIRILSFNITTMTQRDDLLACFDQMATVQNQNRHVKLLVFFDEINAELENHHVYDAFLALLEDGIYFRRGIKFQIQPCIWVFAGTNLQLSSGSVPSQSSSTDKGSDFESRLSFPTIDLAERHNDLHGQDQRAENVYLGLLLARRRHPDLRLIHRTVLEVLANMDSTVSNQDIRRFIDRNFSAVDGMGDWEYPHEIYTLTDNRRFFAFARDHQLIDTLNKKQALIDNMLRELETNYWISLQD